MSSGKKIMSYRTLVNQLGKVKIKSGSYRDKNYVELLSILSHVFSNVMNAISVTKKSKSGTQKKSIIIAATHAAAGTQLENMLRDEIDKFTYTDTVNLIDYNFSLKIDRSTKFPDIQAELKITDNRKSLTRATTMCLECKAYSDAMSDVQAFRVTMSPRKMLPNAFHLLVGFHIASERQIKAKPKLYEYTIQDWVVCELDDLKGEIKQFFIATDAEIYIDLPVVLTGSHTAKTIDETQKQVDVAE